MHGFQLWANLPSTLKMTARATRMWRRRTSPKITDDDGTAGRVSSAASSGARRGPVDGIAADPHISTSTVPAGKRKIFRSTLDRTPSPMSSKARRTFRDASRPFGVLVEKEVNGEEVHVRDMSGNRSLVIFDTGDESDGAGRRKGRALPAGFGQADPRAGRLARADRDEHRRPNSPRPSVTCAMAVSSRKAPRGSKDLLPPKGNRKRNNPGGAIRRGCFV